MTWMKKQLSLTRSWALVLVVFFCNRSLFGQVLVDQLRAGTGYVRAAAIDPNGEQIIMHTGGAGGQVHFFDLTANGWLRRQTINAGIYHYDQEQILAIDGDIAFCGAPRSNASVTSGGAVYVFEREDGTWSVTKTLVADDAESFDYLGVNVAYNDNFLVVAAPTARNPFSYSGGAAYVFSQAGGFWTQRAKIVPPESTGDFATDVAIHGDTIVIGASGDNDGGSNAGAAYVYERQDISGTVWAFRQKLFSGDTVSGDVFGKTVAIHGDTIAVSAPGQDDPVVNAGAVYIFERAAGVWAEIDKLTLVADGSLDIEQYLFGDTGVSLSADRLFVGAQDDYSGTYVHGFYKQGGSWLEGNKVAQGYARTVDHAGDLLVLAALGLDTEAKLYCMSIEDDDGDGVSNCGDTCPNDPDKTEPGSCGCGALDDDFDNDGVPDCIDNCPISYNPDQADQNDDGTGDVCESGVPPIDNGNPTDPNDGGNPGGPIGDTGDDDPGSGSDPTDGSDDDEVISVFIPTSVCGSSMMQVMPLMCVGVAFMRSRRRLR